MLILYADSYSLEKDIEKIYKFCNFIELTCDRSIHINLEHQLNSRMATNLGVCIWFLNYVSVHCIIVENYLGDNYYRKTPLISRGTTHNLGQIWKIPTIMNNSSYISTRSNRTQPHIHIYPIHTIRHPKVWFVKMEN
jgi:hypothetical protein